MVGYITELEQNNLIIQFKNFLYEQICIKFSEDVAYGSKDW